MDLEKKYPIPDLNSIETQILSLKEFNVGNNDVESIIGNLSKYGNIEHIKLNNKIGPYLVIFKEIHYNSEILIDNLNALIKNKNFFNFLTTEGTPFSYEIEYERYKYKNIIGEIIGGNIGISSISIEKYFGNKINTYGVDINYKDLIKIHKSLKNMEEEINSFNLIDFILNKKEEKNKKLLEYFNLKEKSFIDKRNIFWLNSISKILKNTKTKTKNGKNFIPIICGGNHAKGLTENAGKYGFKGVIIFSSKHYK